MVVTNIKERFTLTEQALRYEKIKEFISIGYSTTYAYPTPPHDSVIMEAEEYPLHEVGYLELKAIRNSNQPGFVVKKGGHLLCATSPHLERYLTTNDCIKKQHRCSERDMMCRRLCALPDAQGGCAKVRDKNSAIEDYDFIREGYEFFNVTQSCLVVTECQHWSPNYNATATPQIAQNVLIKRKLALAQYIWPEVKSMSEVRKKMAK